MLNPDFDFAQFLLDRKYIGAAAAAKVRLKADTARVPIGQILVMRGVLTIRQVMTVLEAQADEPDVRFGELAIRLGFLSTVALDAALREQAGSRVHQISVIRGAGILTEHELTLNMVAYVELLERYYKAA